jgi:prolyl-tRNA synthetase
MTHSDDDGLVLPPRLAPKHVVLLPIYRNDEERSQVIPYCESLRRELEAQTFDDGRVQVQLDDRDLRGGEKNWQHVKRGVPLRAEIGPRDVVSGSVFLARRDRPVKEKAGVPRSEFVAGIGKTLADMQAQLFARALKMREDNTRTIDSLAEFKAYFTPHNAERSELHGGFALCHFTEDPEVNELLKDLKVTIRCIPLNEKATPGKCVFTGRPTTTRAVFAKAY